MDILGIFIYLFNLFLPQNLISCFNVYHVFSKPNLHVLEILIGTPTIFCNNKKGKNLVRHVDLK